MSIWLIYGSIRHKRFIILVLKPALSVSEIYISSLFDEQPLSDSIQIYVNKKTTSRAITTSTTSTTTTTSTVNSQCVKPVHDIIFVKTHKTASSIVQNILYRYGTKHRLTFAMPANNGPRFSYPAVFNAIMVKPINKQINIIANHLRASPYLKKCNSIC